MDGHEIEDDFTLFLIQNSQTGGSLLPLAPGASLDDGIMDIGILKKMKRGQILKAFGQLKKEGRHVFHPMVDYYRFKTFENYHAKVNCNKCGRGKYWLNTTANAGIA